MLSSSAFNREHLQSYTNRLGKFLNITAGKEYAIVGSGSCAENILRVLSEKQLRQPVGIFDNNRAGEELAGRVVETLDKIPSNIQFVLMATFEYSQQIQEKLKVALGNRYQQLIVAAISDFDEHHKRWVSEEPIIIVTVPKTGTAFIRSTLRKMLDIEGPCISEGEWPNLLTSNYALGKCLKNNGFTVTHLQGTRYNVDALKNKGIKKIIVQVRDPRQSTLSCLHHLDNIREKTTFSSQYFHVDNYFELNFEQKLDYQMKYEFPEFCQATERWLDMASLDDFEIKFMTFSHMKSQPESYFKEIFEYFGINGEVGEIASPKPGEANFRKGQEDEWKSVFTEQQKTIASETISRRLKSQFGWED